MNKISILKEDKEYMDFLSELPAIQKLRDEHKALQKDIQKKRRRINTLIQKYTFLNDIVAVNNTGTKLSLSIKKALKSIGFSNVHHLDKNGDEDLVVFYGNKALIIEVTGSKDVLNASKVAKANLHFLDAKTRYSDYEMKSCIMFNYFPSTRSKTKNTNPFKTIHTVKAIKNCEMSVLTTQTLKTMLEAVVVNKLTLDEFIERIGIVGEVEYNRA